jgi:hypothetical protein
MTTRKTLPESIIKKIQDSGIEYANRLKTEGKPATFADIWHAAAEAILSNLEAWGLAGVWLNCKDKLPDKDGLYIIEHKNGGRWQMFFKTEDRKWYWQPNPYSVCGDGFIERWLSESATPSDRVQQLEQVLKIIAEWRLPETDRFWDNEKKEPMSYGACYGSNGERDYMKSIATNALKHT